MKMLILTEEQAIEMAGQSTPGHSLDPRPLKSGEYVLPRRVLHDPAHGAKLEFLSSLPERDVGMDEFPQPDA